MLDRLDTRPEFKAALLDQLEAAVLKPEEREVALWLLGQPSNDNATSAA